MQITIGLPDPRQQSSLPLLKRVQAGISHAMMLKGSPPPMHQATNHGSYIGTNLHCSDCF